MRIKLRTESSSRYYACCTTLKYPCEVRMEDGAIVVIDRERAERVVERGDGVKRLDLLGGCYAGA
ncbi:MAG: hypothetical protein QXG25_01500 [Nitrososphaerota archaeon]